MQVILRNPNFLKLQTFGDSMFPLLHDKDIVHVKKKAFSKIRVNDIVCVKTKGKMFTHRVVYRTDNFLITKGDGNTSSDGRVYPKQLLGVVERITRGDATFSISDLYLFQSTLYLREIVKVAAALKKAGVTAVFLKGLPLHIHFEGVHPRRFYADCDLLIGEANFSRAAKVFEGMGYARMDFSISKLQKKLKRREPETSFYKMAGDFPVVFDVHIEAVFLMTQVGGLGRLYPQKQVKALSRKFMEEAENITVFGEKFPILSSSNLAVYLALHLYHHNFRGAHRYDFLKSVFESKVDYADMAKTIIDFNLANFTYPVFLLLEKYYNAGIDRRFMETIRPRGRILETIARLVSSVDIFDEEDRFLSGIVRFKNLFMLSPSSFLHKLPTFLSREVAYAVLWVFWVRVERKIPGWGNFRNSPGA